MKNSKKVISFIVMLCFVFSNTVVAFGASLNLTDDPILLDEYSADHYEMAAYQNGDMFYVITVLSDGNIELAFAEKETPARTLWMNMQDIMANSRSANIALSLDDIAFVNAVIDYGIANQDESEPVQVQVVNTQTRAVDTDDYNSLIDQLMGIHGLEHSEYNWTGMSSQIYNGLIFNYREMLNYDMTYRDSFAFNMGATLGGLVATIAAAIPGWSVSMGVIATVLGVSALVNTSMEHSGSIASYYGSAVYSRYVMVEGSGPYYECYKRTNYDGWVEEGNYNSATLEDLGTSYSASQEIFNSYVMQRTRAYDSYI